MYRRRARSHNDNSALKYMLLYQVNYHDVVSVLSKTISICKFRYIVMIIATTILLGCSNVNPNSDQIAPTSTSSTKQIFTSQANNLDVGHSVGKTALDLTFTDTEMATYSIEDYSNKSVILYFYASW